MRLASRFSAHSAPARSTWSRPPTASPVSTTRCSRERRARVDPAAPRPAGPPRPGRAEAPERGRPVVNLRVPLALGQAAVSYVPGLNADDAARVRDALARGISGPILEGRDGDGDGARG